MYGKLKALWQSSEFAVENLSFRETVGLLLEKYGYRRDAFLFGESVECPELVADFERAVSGEPLGYILGKVPFYKEEYFVEEGVLIPRCDSEIIVEKAIELIPEGAHFADVCTGSGCLKRISRHLGYRTDASSRSLTCFPTACPNARRL